MTPPIEMIKQALSRSLVRTLDGIGAHRTLAALTTPYVREIQPKGDLAGVRPQPACRQQSILALDADRFRGELELLSANSEFRVLTISWGLLTKLLEAFVDNRALAAASSKNGVSPGQTFAKAEVGTPIHAQRKRYRAFLRKFLPALYDLFGIRALTCTDTRFFQQKDIGWVTAELGVPLVCLYREALYMVPILFERAADRHRKLAPFHFDVVGVQNEITREMLLSSGAFTPDQIEIRGCARMDTYLHRLESDNRASEQPQVTVFSSIRRVARRDGGHIDLSQVMLRVVRRVARLARRCREVRFVIKFKDQHLKEGAREAYEAAIREAAGGIPQNIVFNTDRMAAQDVILQSRVVIAMQSTVVLEAAIAGRPVILPHFRSLTAEAGAEDALMYLGEHHLFDVPADEDDLERMVLERLADPHVSDEVMAGRRALFERYVSPLSGDATERTIAIFEQAIECARARRTTGDA